MLDCSTWTHRHPHGRRTRLATDRCCSARRPDHRDQQVGQARSSATPLLSDGDIMGFKSPGQFTHKPPQLAAASASSISRAGGTVGWLWNLRSEWTTWRPPYPSCTGSSPAHRLSAQDRTLPDVWSKHTTWKGGPEPAKRATNPRRYSRNGIPSARKVPRSGHTSQPEGRSHPSDSDRLPPERPGSCLLYTSPSPRD